MKFDEATVVHSTGQYPVILYENFQGLGEELRKIGNVSQVVIITERNIGQMYLKYLEAELAGFEKPIHTIFIKGGEKNKHIDRVKKIYHELIDLDADRKSVLVALGGGVVGDFAGFIAATYQRGIRFIQIPTTLLACVDSSVGGKVAVNVDKGKNMVGAFHQPCFVFIPLFALATLSQKEWKCGLAEIMKHSLLSGGEMWEDFRSHSRNDIQPQSEILRKFILDSVKFKAGVVGQDEKESGLRAILNLGHTTAHAIESRTKYKKYSHGEAVSIGLVTAIYLSQKKLNFPKEKIQEILNVMDEYALPIVDRTKPSEIIEHMEHDKKKDGNDLKFVLLEDIGKPQFGIPVDRKEILGVLKDQRKLA